MQLHLKTPKSTLSKARPDFVDGPVGEDWYQAFNWELQGHLVTLNTDITERTVRRRGKVIVEQIPKTIYKVGGMNVDGSITVRPLRSQKPEAGRKNRRRVGPSYHRDRRRLSPLIVGLLDIEGWDKVPSPPVGITE